MFKAALASSLNIGCALKDTGLGAQYTLCNTMHYAVCNMHYSICIMHYECFIMHYTIRMFNMQYALCNLFDKYASCDIQYALYDMCYSICLMIMYNLIYNMVELLVLGGHPN